MSKCGINAVKELFADSPDLSLSRVDKATCGVVGEVRFVVFKSYKGFAFCSDVNSVI